MPVDKYISAKAVTRQNKAKVVLPANIEIEEKNAVKVADVKYDVDVIAKSKESAEVQSRPHDQRRLVYVNGEKYHLEVLNGRVGYSYFIHRPMGKSEFDITVPT